MLVYTLNLPPPDSDIVAAFRNWETSAELDPSNRKWLYDFHHGKINCVAYQFSLVPELTASLQSQYQQYFNRPIYAVCGIMESCNNTIATHPPHTDRGRKLAINWYFDLGGNEVDTVFYNEKSDSIVEATNYLHQDITEVARYRLQNNTWYAFDARQCHSIEHIQSRRTFMAIIVDECDLEELLQNNSIELLTV